MFSWRNVSSRDYRERTGVALPSGSYAADAIDQHQAAWCGCCYIVAPVQCIEDRARIAFAKRGKTKAPKLSLQAVLDHFRLQNAKHGWNACHGGFSLQVLQCLEDRTCPLLRVREAPVLLGFPRLLTRCPVPDAGLTVSGVRRLRPDEVRDSLLHEGPVVLELHSDVLKSADARGVVTDRTPRVPNHVVCVVGWRDGCWIVRNSWGARRAPRSLPDLACVGHDRNECQVAWEAWSGDPRDPGFALVPFDHPALALAPSPWMAATVA